MRKTVFLVSLLLLGMGLAGCTPKPRVPIHEESSISTAGTLPAAELPFMKPRFGQFNIHKRHGLGGWEGNAHAGSERELLRRLSTQR